MRVVATAGHVDHGKSTLVLALTGTDPDRFAEEKVRGLTIDLGFAFTTLPSGVEVGFVDVPGHERFVKNMLAGVGAVDVALFVVAAGEGWRPQSEEHLQILDVLAVRHGVVAVTKADTVHSDLVELTLLDVDEHLASSSLYGAPVVVCDAVSGRGLDDVRAALDQVLAAAGPPVDRSRPRLWIDRVFAPRGAGTVVTGTLTGGGVAVDDTLRIVRLDRTVRVRAIETAHRAVDRIGPGARVALNLAGVDHHELGRGDALVRPGQWIDASTVDVLIRPMPTTPARFPTRVRAAVGSGEHAARVRMLDEEAHLARARFETALPLVVGDRFVLRDPARALTIAGAEVLDVESSCSAAAARAALRRPGVARMLAGHGWQQCGELARRLGVGGAGVDELVDEAIATGDAAMVGEWLAPPADVDELRVRARAVVDTHHSEQPLSAGLDVAVLATAIGRPVEHVRAALIETKDLTVQHGIVSDPTRTRLAADTEAGRALVELLDATPFSPPAPSDPRLARALVREGVLVDVDGIVFTAAALEKVRTVLRDALADGAELSVADVRQLLGSSRKYVVPLLGHLDREGFTRRRGDVRVAGPRVGQL